MAIIIKIKPEKYLKDSHNLNYINFKLLLLPFVQLIRLININYLNKKKIYIWYIILISSVYLFKTFTIITAHDMNSFHKFKQFIKFSQ